MELTRDKHAAMHNSFDYTLASSYLQTIFDSSTLCITVWHVTHDEMLDAWLLHCRATGATALVKLAAPQPDELGFAKSLALEEIGGTNVVVLQQDASQGQVLLMNADSWHGQA